MTQSAMPAASKNQNELSTKPAKAAPRLSPIGLTVMLVFVIATPLTILTWLHFTLPGVHELDLKAEVTPVDFPPADYFQKPIEERDWIYSHPGLKIKNTGDQDWTNIIVSVNRRFKWIPNPEHGGDLPAGKEKVFYLHRFQMRTGTLFEPDKFPVKNVYIYARLPSGERATYFLDLENSES